MLNIKFDKSVPCFHCNHEQEILSIPLVSHEFDGNIHQCRECKKFFRVGAIVEFRVSPLKGD